MGTPFIHLNSVSKSYQSGKTRINVLTDITMSLKKGQSAVIAGPSGSGKTTLLNLLGGLDTCDTGEIFVNSYSLHDYSEKQLTDFRRNEIGLVFQDDALIPELNVYENIELPLEILGTIQAERGPRITSLLADLGLENKVTRFPRELSGGEKQRVSIARAVVHRPSLVLADEPTANLDRESLKRVIDTIRQFSENMNITFLITTHDPYVMSQFDILFKLNYGHLEQP